MSSWLAWVVDPLNHVLFQLADDAVSWAELLGFLTGGLCVFLTVRRHVLNFPIGIANSLLFLILFMSARLWADAALQVMFVALGFSGWWRWVRSRGATDDIRVLTAGRGEMLTWLVGVAALTWLLTDVLAAAHDTAPFWDALTTSLSIAAQWLLNARKLQTWYFWIAADCIYIPLYVLKRLDLTAIVYVLFLSMCIAGLTSWRRTRRDLEAPGPQPQRALAAG